MGTSTRSSAQAVSDEVTEKLAGSAESEVGTDEVEQDQAPSVSDESAPTTG